MSITRAQIPEQIKGYSQGDPVVAPVLNPEVNTPPIGTTAQQLAAQLDELERLQGQRTIQPTKPELPDFEADFLDYKKRLETLLGKPGRIGFYDLVSDLGKAMLTTDPTIGPFQSAGLGFANFNERLRKRREEQSALTRQAGIQAFEMAQSDQKRAADFLNQFDLETAKAAARAPKLQQFKYDVVDDQGNVVGTDTVDVNINNPAEVQLARSLPGSQVITTPENALTINEAGNDKFADLTADALRDQLTDVRKDAEKADKMLFQLDQLENAAKRLNYDVGLIKTQTKKFRQVLSELGLREDPTLADSDFIETINTQLSLLLVAQTKGPISDREMATFKAAMPGLGATPEGLKKQIQYMRAVADYERKFFSDYTRDEELGQILGDNTKSPFQKEQAFNRWKLDWKKNNPQLKVRETGEEFTIGGLANRFGGQETEKARSYRLADDQNKAGGVNLPGDVGDD